MIFTKSLESENTQEQTIFSAVAQTIPTCKIANSVSLEVEDKDYLNNIYDWFVALLLRSQKVPQSKNTSVELFGVSRLFYDYVLGWMFVLCVSLLPGD